MQSNSSRVIRTHDEKSPFSLSISLSVLDDLGIRLYSNVPAVLSEIVANAWDADATTVSIEIVQADNTIIVTDDGNGMDEEDINKKYLTVGYRKREVESARTPLGRAPMGRKGIGKLAVFSIAKTLEVHSVKSGVKNAIVMNSDDIKEIIADGRSTYKPRPLDSSRVTISKGTRLVLRDLKKNVTSATDEALRKRLARRFSVIGAQHNFKVNINGQEISIRDRGYYNLVQFMWHFGEGSDEYVARCSNIQRDFVYPDHLVQVGSATFPVRGWVATVFNSGTIDDETNTIVAFANGKLIHENILADLKEAGVYASFVIGEIDADFMDRNEEDDIVTSNRQSVHQDAERYIALKQFVRKLLKEIERNWVDLRTEKGAEVVLRDPLIQKWYERLPKDQRKTARKVLGRIESLGLPDARSKNEMIKANMLAFEKLALTQQLELFDSVETIQQFEVLQNVIGNVTELERAHYYQIARGRVEIIRAFEKIIDDDQKERVIQQFLFKYLWLLDPSWEMSKGTSRMEERVTTEFREMEKHLSQDEIIGRIDIRYMTIAGTHVIVELKKYSVTTTAFDLAGQVEKYQRALKRCLERSFPEYVHPAMRIECICVVGKAPPHDAETTYRVLDAVNAKLKTYDELIQRARNSYEEFLLAERQVTELLEIIESVGESVETESMN